MNKIKLFMTPPQKKLEKKQKQKQLVPIIKFKLSSEN